MKRTISIISISIMLVSLATVAGYASNLPRSKEGTLIESASPTEVMVRAKGIGYWEKGMSKDKDRDKTLLANAEEDGRKAAVYFVLYGGTDPLLSGETERNSFAPYEEEFFASDNVRRFIAWEGEEYLSRVLKPLEKNKRYELHIEKAYKVNKQLIEDWLTSKNILPARAVVTEALGMPFIMVIPVVKSGEDPIKVLQSDPDLSHAAKVIESYLTARQYDVVVPEQQQDLSALTAAQQSLKGVEEDFSYQLALSIGSDVYITYEVNIQSDAYNTRKAVVSVRAYETTTARLLGTETGYSPSASAAPMVLIENAVNDAIDKVLSRIMDYWKSDLQNGVQYKLIVSLSPNFNDEDREELTFLMGDLLKELTRKGKYKENIVTDATLDYLIWCDPAEFDKSSSVYRWLKEKVAEEYAGADLKRVNLNRKLIILKLDPA
jgi:hypothetical protein